MHIHRHVPGYYRVEQVGAPGQTPCGVMPSSFAPHGVMSPGFTQYEVMFSSLYGIIPAGPALHVGISSIPCFTVILNISPVCHSAWTLKKKNCVLNVDAVSFPFLLHTTRLPRDHHPGFPLYGAMTPCSALHWSYTLVPRFTRSCLKAARSMGKCS